jgi:hypothetical protein
MAVFVKFGGADECLTAQVFQGQKRKLSVYNVMVYTLLNVVLLDPLGVYQFSPNPPVGS